MVAPMAWFERWRDRGGAGHEGGHETDRTTAAPGAADERVPAPVGFLSVAEWASLGHAVDTHLEERGVSYHREGVELVLDDPQGRASLVNLAHRCRHAPLDEWPSLVARHFAPLLDLPPDGLAQVDGFAARANLRVRIVGTDWLDRIPPDDDLVIRSIAPGLVAVLFVDLPGAIASVSPEDLTRWELSPVEAFDLGFDNVRLQEPVEVVRSELGNGVDGSLVVGDNHFVATNVLWLDDLLDLPSPQGALVILPHRHAIVVHPLVRARPASMAIHRLAELAATMHGEGPGSLTNAVYWWRIGQLDRLRTQLRPGGMSMTTTEEFDRMMRSLPR